MGPVFVKGPTDRRICPPREISEETFTFLEVLRAILSGTLDSEFLLPFTLTSSLRSGFIIAFRAVL